MTRIPITMCHGLRSEKGADYPLPGEHFEHLVGIARDLGFESIDYDQLHAWREAGGTLPDRPIMFDFDHPDRSMRHGVHDILARHGFRGNLFINTGWFAPEHDSHGQCMSWDEVRELVDLGWHIGAHTVTHPNLSELVAEDPQGERLRWELETCDATLEQELGIVARDFAFTGTSWSGVAEELVSQRYRFGRLWVVGAEYQADGRRIRLAELMQVEGEDEADGGPPLAARYITEQSHPYRLPSMELQRNLIHDPDDFRAYLEGALT